MPQRSLTFLPPELLLHIAEAADCATLCSLLRASKFLHFLLWPVLYRREARRPNPVGLIRSIRLGSVAAVSKFLVVGADVNARITPGDFEDFSSYTYPLATAVVRNQRPIVDLLLAHGADTNAPIDGFLCHTILADHVHPWAGVLSNTPLTVAVALGSSHADVAVQLARSLADPDAVVTAASSSAAKFSALEQAARCLRPEVVRQLLARGADPDRRRARDEATLLHGLLEDAELRAFVGTAEGGEAAFAEVVMAFLQHGSDPFIERVCQDHRHGGDGHGDRGAVCGERCKLTAWSVGAGSPYPRIRKHFRDLGHRQDCGRLACRGSRLDYAVGSEDIPGHCQVA
ncbi:hypothetical protein C8A05DRAFT_30388 [Staphylotrichum tortipilum]|uniref:Uncharacterized protein n=1 Tax=Staphylotrichum tortipilum TaxID=2831512 RepID=A0AAN6MSK7_9PEZI|nr:hypothetical protein C8A05DRAFT_30388 [Staphylotrichum longicolle]